MTATHSSARPTPVPEDDVPSVAPIPRTYDHLARTTGRRWYVGPAALLALVVAGLLFVLLLGSAVDLAAVIAGIPLDADGLPVGPGWSDAAGLLIIAATLPAVLLVVRFVERRRPGTLSSVTGRLRGRWLAVCLVPAMAVSVLAGVVGELVDPTGGTFAGWSSFLGVVVVTLVLTPFQVGGRGVPVPGLDRADVRRRRPQPVARRRGRVLSCSR